MEIILQIPGEDKKVVMKGDSITIGRNTASSDLVVEDEGLSRSHAVIHRHGNEVRIIDQQSVNGTYVNCELVLPGGMILADGDEIFVGNRTTITVRIKHDVVTGEVKEHRPNLVFLFAAPLLVIAVLIGAVVTHVLRTPGAVESHEVESRTRAREVIVTEPTPAPTAVPNDSKPPIDETELNAEPEIPVGPARLYKSFSEEEKREFIKVRAGRIAVMMGKRPYAFTPDALDYIKFWLEAFAGRVGNNRTGLWRGDTRFILQRGSIHAPVIIRAFKENRVPPVIGLYIPFIETEYTNISSNNAAGAAGLFQFLGPTAEHYGVPSSERTNVEKMAPAAARYFRDNIMSFGDDSMSVALAIAGYNRAPESVKRDLRNILSADNNEDKERNFWTLIANQGRLDHYFQNENKNYVPRFFAAAILGETPWAFGIQMRPLSTYTTPVSSESAGNAANQ